MSTSPSPPIPVLYVGGFTRSGSTLLAYLLGALPGFHPVGELRELWTKGLMYDNLCSCGERFSGCPFWTSVGERAFGGWQSLDAAELAATSEALATETRLVPVLLTRRRGPARLARLRERTAKVYRAVSELTGGSVIVDSSKVAPYALLCADHPAVDLRVVHLIRDSRGVAFSWAKRNVVKPDSADGKAVMDTYGMNATALRWSYHNSLFSLLWTKRVPVVRMRYEQLVAEPADEVRRALARLRLGADAVGDEEFCSGQVSLGDAHTIGGNPMRFRGREQTVRLDDQWQRAMSPRAFGGVTLLTWPLLWRYGYDRRRERR